MFHHYRMFTFESSHMFTRWNPYVDLFWRVGDCISLISNDFISIWNHLKPMKSLGLKPSVLFETTSLGWFHWFQIELKSFEVIWNQWNPFKSKWNQWNRHGEVVSNRTDGFNPRDFIHFKWFQIEMKSFEINEIDFSVFLHLKSMKPFPMAIEINEIATLSTNS